MSAAVVAAGRRMAPSKEEHKKRKKSSGSVFEGWRNAGWANGYIEDELDCLADFSKVLIAHRLASGTSGPAVTGPAAGSIRKVSEKVKYAEVGGSDKTAGQTATELLSSNLTTSPRKSSVVNAIGKAIPSPSRGRMLPQRCRHHKASLGVYDRELLATLVRSNAHLEERDLMTYMITSRQKVVPISPSSNEIDIVTYVEKMKNFNQNARNNGHGNYDAMNSNQNAGGTEVGTPGDDGQGEGATEAISKHSIKLESLNESMKTSGEEEEDKGDDVLTPRTLAKMTLAAKTRIRRCVAEDLLWSLKTVPSLDQLAIKNIAANFQG